MHTRKRLRLRDWLVNMINSGSFSGLQWEDPKEKVFRVPWKHGSRHGWTVEDASLFRAWAVYTGKFKEGKDKPDPRKWKTNFRCALNALPDIREIRTRSCPRGKDAFKVYQMKPSLRYRGNVLVVCKNFGAFAFLLTQRPNFPSLQSQNINTLSKTRILFES